MKIQWHQRLCLSTLVTSSMRPCMHLVRPNQTIRASERYRQLAFRFNSFLATAPQLLSMSTTCQKHSVACHLGLYRPVDVRPQFRPCNRWTPASTLACIRSCKSLAPISCEAPEGESPAEVKPRCAHLPPAFCAALLSNHFLNPDNLTPAACSRSLLELRVQWQTADSGRQRTWPMRAVPSPRAGVAHVDAPYMAVGFSKTSAAPAVSSPSQRRPWLPDSKLCHAQGH